ncbi:MAG TPA: HAMP domain-containing sensor histidine kinase [Steroidobacteraceae bacterium]
MRMRWARPKSLSGLMLLGLALIAVPLVVALVDAVLQIRVLADTERKLVDEGIKATRASQEMSTTIADLDRTARYYDLLKTPDLLEVYRSKDQLLSAFRGQLERQLRTPAALKTLEAMKDLQGTIRLSVLSMPHGAADPRELSQRFDELRALSQRLVEQSNAEIDAEVAALEEQAQRSRVRLAWESALLVPLTIIAIIAVTLAVGRPLRALDRAISELGSGTISREIVVSGPHDLERLGRQLEWLRGRLLDLAQERSRFLRHMSHELKTPLANIREGTELLMDGAVGELDGNQREVTGILRENGIKLQRLIENLLSFSAWQTSSSALDMSEFRLRPLVKQVLENQQLTLLSQRVRLDVKIEDVVLVADRGKVRLILENLLSNAVKYSPKGGAIHMSAARSFDQLVLDVADNGPGIAPEDRSHIFDAFYTGRAAKGGSLKGTGIGLSVVLEFVNAHGGSVQIVDGEFPGAHFRIVMPINANAGDKPAAPRQAKEHAHAA